MLRVGTSPPPQYFALSICTAVRPDSSACVWNIYMPTNETVTIYEILIIFLMKIRIYLIREMLSVVSFRTFYIPVFQRET